MQNKKYVQIGDTDGHTVSLWTAEDNTLCYCQTMQCWLDENGWQKVGQINDKVLHPLGNETVEFLKDALNVQ